MSIRNFFAAINVFVGCLATLFGCQALLSLINLRGKSSDSLGEAAVLFICILCLSLLPLAVHGILYFSKGKVSQKLFQVLSIPLILLEIALYLFFMWAMKDDLGTLILCILIAFLTYFLFQLKIFWAGKIRTVLVIPIIFILAASLTCRDVNAMNLAGSELQKTLVEAVDNENLEELAAIIQVGVDVDVVGDDQNTPLMMAVLDNKPNVAELLVKAGADVNFRNKFGLTPLLIAVVDRNREMTKFLIDHGANVNTRLHTDEGVKSAPSQFIWYYQGLSPLLLAVSSDDVKTVRILLSAKAEVDAKTLKGNTALMMAADAGNMEIVKCLLAAGADAFLENNKRQNAIDLAAMKDEDEIVTTLMPVADDNNLLSAISAGDPDRVKALLAGGADPNGTNNFGESPLMRAARQGQWGVISNLLGAGADIGAKDRFGNTVLYYALNTEAEIRTKTVKLLIRKGADVNVWFKVPIRGMSRINILHIATYFNDLDLIKFLLDAGADPNVKDDQGASILASAIYDDSVGLMALLIGAGASVNTQDMEGETPLMVAVRNENVEAIKMLLKSGADESLINKMDRTALVLAQEREFEEGVELLSGKSASRETNKQVQQP